MPHRLLAWCLFSPRVFLQSLPRVHLASVFPPTSVRCTILLILRGLFLVVGFRSTCSSIPPFGRIWECCSFCSVEAKFGVPSQELYQEKLLLGTRVQTFWWSLVSPVLPVFPSRHSVFPCSHWFPRLTMCIYR